MTDPDDESLIDDSPLNNENESGLEQGSLIDDSPLNDGDDEPTDLPTFAPPD